MIANSYQLFINFKSDDFINNQALAAFGLRLHRFALKLIASIFMRTHFYKNLIPLGVTQLNEQVSTAVKG
ncbi:MAG: hypothetical protein AUG51_15320 [Acidobacteria bacterium 13_1_20CM_3_53_8]|nr:MAG: hypothetical protein AUG51_15320 [Acidobacteria bacterium 13_1_20CM_3_53_8]